MEIVTAMIGPIVESLMVPVKKHMGYVVFSTRHVTEMGTRMRHLDGIGADVNKHMVENNESILEVPDRVPSWLDEVKKIKDEVETISTIRRGCFNLKMRHKAGRKASKITLEIERLIKENSEIIWTNHQIPLGKVISSSGGATQNDFRSRDQTFKEALEFLHPKHEAQIIALCGMGGVGKTTMMEQLKKAVGTFYLVVKAVVGEKTDPIAIQQAIADYMSEPLTESTKTARADRLRLRFKEISKEGQNKVMVILDDLWEMVDLNDIGLSPLPNGFKVLLTSRNEKVCTLTAEEAHSTVRVIRVDVLKEPEAHDFFFQIAGVSQKTDLELNQIGLDIVKKCGFLPLAIKLIATTLKNEDKFAWNDALNRLEMNDLDGNVRKIIEMSYDYLKKDEAKTIFLLCGLFPDDFDIPVEELTRYAWGLKVLGVPTLCSARNRTKTCVRDLQNANLLIASDRSGCVKMHDLVLSFVLGVVSKSEHAWIINHGGVSKWSTSETVELCKSISMTCTGTSEFPEDFKYPNLSLLKLMHGDGSVRFLRDFFKSMEKIEVVAFEKMHYPLLPRSLQCSTNLRTLCLYQCLFVNDISPIGNLLNLEVLSFSYCNIQRLPSAIGNLKRLKLLDLTGSVNLQIDDGVLQNLVELEELYMRVADEKAINFTVANYNELAERLKTLSALEIEFWENMAWSTNMFWKKLKRFRISLGCHLEGNEADNVHSFENTLTLCTTTGELFESKINELFEKADVILLRVDDMNDLEDVLLKPMHPPQHSLFYNLRVLTILRCGELKYIFTPGIATCLSKLERLTISSCHAMEVVIHSDNNETIKFQELKFLSLGELPELVSLCNTTSVIELPKLVELRLAGLPNFSSIYPENKSMFSMSIDVSAMRPFLNKEVVIPKLETLDISIMENLKEIWPCRFSRSEEDNICRLRNIWVNGCDNLVNLFPRNPMPWLHHLEELYVKGCGSIEVIFDLDLGCVHEIEECSSINSLRGIVLENLEELREVWKVKGINDSRHIIRGFQAVRIIRIEWCKSFRNVFTPITAIFDLGALEDIYIERSDHLGESGKNNKLVESSSSINTNTFGQQGITRTSHVLQFNWNIFLVRQQQESVFYNLTKIVVRECKNIKYLLSPLAVKLLSNLKTIEIHYCDSFEEVISNKDGGDEEMTTSTSTHKNASFLPYFDSLDLLRLPCLKQIGGGNNVITSNVTTNATVVQDSLQHAHVAVASWSLCQYSRKIRISCCNALSSVIPSYAVGQLQKLEELRVDYCNSMLELFESQNIYNCINIGEGSFGTSTVLTIPIPRMKTKPLVELCNLRILSIRRCAHLKYIFTCSTLESLKQLKELKVDLCTSMHVIVKEEDGEQTTTTSEVVVLPRLESIELEDLPNLKGFFMGSNKFQWPSLDNVKIIACPQMMVFTSRHSKAPKLNYIHSSLGKHSLECGLNFHLTTTTLQETQFSTSGGSSSFLTSKGIPLSFSNLIEVNASYNDELRNIIPFDELLKVKKLEKINVENWHEVVEVFEAFKRENSGLNESQSVVKFPELREVNLERLLKLEYIWRNDRWTKLEFPNLTSLSIKYCALLGHVFTCSIVDSLAKLQQLYIFRCGDMEVIVKEEEEENRGKEVVFPCLKSLQLEHLGKLKGFSLGKEDFLWPSLHTLKIQDCPEITVFTNGLSTTPQLKFIDTSIGGFYVEEDINSFIKIRKQEGFEF